jgi:hypothetical protein
MVHPVYFKSSVFWSTLYSGENWSIFREKISPLSWRSKSKPNKIPADLCFLLLQKQHTSRYIPQDRTLCRHCLEHLKFKFFYSLEREDGQIQVELYVLLLVNTWVLQHCISKLSITWHISSDGNAADFSKQVVWFKFPPVHWCWFQIVISFTTSNCPLLSYLTSLYSLIILLMDASNLK